MLPRKLSLIAILKRLMPLKPDSLQHAFSVEEPAIIHPLLLPSSTYFYFGGFLLKNSFKLLHYVFSTTFLSAFLKKVCTSHGLG